MLSRGLTHGTEFKVGLILILGISRGWAGYVDIISSPPPTTPINPCRLPPLQLGVDRGVHVWAGFESVQNLIHV
jgi:hypothetical protein